MTFSFKTIYFKDEKYHLAKLQALGQVKSFLRTPWTLAQHRKAQNVKVFFFNCIEFFFKNFCYNFVLKTFATGTGLRGPHTAIVKTLAKFGDFITLLVPNQPTKMNFVKM